MPIESPTIKEFLYQHYSELTNYFVQNAPAYLTHNVNSTRQLSNGTPVTYHSIVLHDEENAF